MLTALGGGSFSWSGILPGVIGLTREGVTVFRLFPHFWTIACYNLCECLWETSEPSWRACLASPID
jgi:hypothetical protein